MQKSYDTNSLGSETGVKFYYVVKDVKELKLQGCSEVCV